MRKCYLDNLRWATVVTVVLYHVFYMFNGVAAAGVVGPFRPVQYQDAVQYVLYPWVMVLLFAVSGMSARYALEGQSDGAFLRARTVKLLVPSTLGLLVFQWLQGYVSMDLSGALEPMSAVPGPVFYLIMALSGTGVLWYIQMLWIFSLALVLIRRVERQRLSAWLARRSAFHPALFAALGVAVWAFAQVGNTPVVVVYRFGLYGFVFLLGYFLLANEAATDCLVRYSLPLAVLATALAAANTVVHFGQNYAVEPVVNSPLTVAYLWCAVLALLGGAKRYADKTSPLAAWMGKKSWGLYVFHYLPLSVTGLLLTRYTSLPPLLIYLLSGAAAFAGALALYALISRIPVVRWCVLGIEKNRSGEQEARHVS
ncbi:MAG: acyltransferase [Oscillospiraceae bacterium]|nr:acyltransferase [Oscillospiraceae bacterium]